jgi:hypothetical protein
MAATNSELAEVSREGLRSWAVSDTELSNEKAYFRRPKQDVSLDLGRTLPLFDRP